MITFLANHLWQSTLFALAAAALVAALRDNRAPIRHWIWVIASVKWLVPFAWLMTAGSAVSGMLAAPGVVAPALQAPSAISISVLQFTEPFTAVDSVEAASSAASNGWVTIAIVILWACGVLAMGAIRLRDWLRIRTAIRQSTSLDIGISRTGLDVRSSPGLLEPRRWNLAARPAAARGDHGSTHARAPGIGRGA